MKSGMILHMVAFLLVIIGALNWGLIGLFNENVVHMIVGAWPTVERVVYILVGVSAVYIGITHKKDCKMCAKM